MAKIVVVFHSGYGHTQRLAQAVARVLIDQTLARGAMDNVSVCVVKVTQN